MHQHKCSAAYMHAIVNTYTSSTASHPRGLSDGRLPHCGLHMAKSEVEMLHTWKDPQSLAAGYRHCITEQRGIRSMELGLHTQHSYSPHNMDCSTAEAAHLVTLEKPSSWGSRASRKATVSKRVSKWAEGWAMRTSLTRSPEYCCSPWPHSRPHSA